jgi:hypothetical protein
MQLWTANNQDCTLIIVVRHRYYISVHTWSFWSIAIAISAILFRQYLCMWCGQWTMKPLHSSNWLNWCLAYANAHILKCQCLVFTTYLLKCWSIDPRSIQWRQIFKKTRRFKTIELSANSRSWFLMIYGNIILFCATIKTYTTIYKQQKLQIKRNTHILDE